MIKRTSKPGRTSANDDRRFWGILKRTVAANTLPFERSDLSALADGHVQLFEVLVTETLADFCPVFTWRTTKLVGDDGIDLEGRLPLVQCSINRTPLIMEHVVLGQVKRSREFNSDVAFGIVERIILGARKQGLPISHLIVVISGEGTTTDQYTRLIQDHASGRMPGVPVKVIDAVEFVACWEANPRKFAGSLASALKDPADIDFIEKYLSRRRSNSESRWKVTASAPIGSRVRGAVLDASVTIKAPLALPGHEVGVAWWPGPGVEVVRPLAALADAQTENCVRIVLDHNGCGSMLVRYRAAISGTLNLGELELVEGAGELGLSETPPQRFPLGEIRVEKGFDLSHVRYLPTPQDESARKLESALDRSRAGGIEVIALIGPGGIGKTRMVDEIVDGLQATRNDAHIGRRAHLLPAHLRIEHATDRNGVPRFLLDVALALAGPELLADAVIGEQRVIADPGEALRNWLGRFTRGRQSHAEAALEALLGRGNRSNPAAVVLLLLQCLIARTRHGPVLLHLANLHWLTSFEISVLAELIRRLREIAQSLHNGVLLVLEGRTKEMVSRVGGPQTTDDWAELLALPGVAPVRLDMWSERHSAEFLRRVLRHVGSPKHTVNGQDVLTRDPVWQRLQRHVLCASSGNPMHIIEHVRLLLTRDVLVFDDDGSLVVSGVLPPGQTAWPLLEMIKDRAEYVRRDPSYAEVTASLKIFAEIGLTVDRALFEAIANAVTDSRYTTRLDEISVARRPGMGVEEFQFVHETYRAAFRDLPWRAADGEHLRQAALQRLEPVEALPARRIVAWARLKCFDPGCGLDEVRDVLLAALERAEQSFEFEGMAALCEELLALPRYIVDAGKRPVKKIRLALAVALGGAGDWEEALHQLELAAKSRRGTGPDDALFQAEVAHERGNTLGDLLRCAEAIGVVRAALAAIDPFVAAANDRLQACRELLLNRLGVLHWFSGRADIGISYQWQALRSARRHDAGGAREILFLTEVGTVMLHRYPDRGRSLLERACELLERRRDELSPLFDYVDVQLQMARLVVPSAHDSLEDIEHRCVEIAEGRSRPASIYGGLLAWLTAGAAAFLANRLPEAEEHLAEALWLANIARSKRVTWKVHLALAAVLTEQKRVAPARKHACLAADILIESLDLIGTETYAQWAATIRLPLEYARRLLGREPYPPLEACLRKVDAGSPPQWATDWPSRPIAQSKTRNPFQILHVRRDVHDIFLMG